jgi:hypothetical protein
MIPVTAVVVMAVLSIWTGWFFYIDEAGYYIRGSMYVPQLVMTYGYIVFCAIKVVIKLFIEKEFEKQNTWDLIEEICQKLSGREDTWYATNMEIYEYTKAYESLVYSADGTKVYNPSLHTIWFDVDRTLYKVTPGETIRIS